MGLAAERFLFDRLIMAIDGQSLEDMAKANARARKRAAGDAFWLPGKALPDRMPDFSKLIVGG